MILFDVLMGVLLVLFGRRLYWLFVGVSGFFAGLSLAKQWLTGQPEMVAVLIGLGLGVICAILAIFLRRLAIAIGGFFAMGQLFAMLAVHMKQESLQQPAFIVGGIIGAILVLVLFDWALVVLSSLVGGVLVTQNVPIEPIGQLFAFVVLVVIGISVQSRDLSRPVGRRR